MRKCLVIRPICAHSPRVAQPYPLNPSVTHLHRQMSPSDFATSSPSINSCRSWAACSASYPPHQSIWRSRARRVEAAKEGRIQSEQSSCPSSLPAFLRGLQIEPLSIPRRTSFLLRTLTKEIMESRSCSAWALDIPHRTLMILCADYEHAGKETSQESRKKRNAGREFSQGLVNIEDFDGEKFRKTA